MDAVIDEALRALLRVTSSSYDASIAVERTRASLVDLDLADPASLTALAQHLVTHRDSLADDTAALVATGHALAHAFPDQPPAFSVALSTLASPSPAPLSSLAKFYKALGVGYKMMLEGGGTASMLQTAMGQLRPSVSEDSARMTASAVRWVVGLPKGKTLRPKDLAPLAAIQVKQRLDYLLSLAKPARDGLIGREALATAIQEVRPLEERAGGGVQSVAALQARHALEQQERAAAQQALTTAAAIGAEQDGRTGRSSSSSADGGEAAAATQPGPGLREEDGETARTSRTASPSVDAHDATFAEEEAPASPTASTSSQTGSAAGDEVQGDARDVEEQDEAAADEEGEGEEEEPAAAESEEEEEVDGARLGRRASSPLTPLVSDDDDGDDGSHEHLDQGGLADAASARSSSGASARGASPAPRFRPSYSYDESDEDNEDVRDAPRRRKRPRLAGPSDAAGDDDEAVQDQDDLDNSPVSPPPPVLEYDLVTRTTRLSMTPGPPSFKEPPAKLELDASPRDLVDLLTHPPAPKVLDADADVDVLPFSLPTETAPEHDEGRLRDEERARLGLGPTASTLAAFRALEPRDREQAVLSMEEEYARLLQGLAAKLGASMAEAAYWFGEANLFHKRSSADRPSPSSPKLSARADELSRLVLNGDSARSADQASHGSDDDDDDWVDADESDDEMAALTRSAMQEAIDGLLAAAEGVA